MVAQQFDGFDCIARLDGDQTVRKAFLKLAEHGGKDVLASRRACAHPQPAVPPFSQLLQGDASSLHLLKNFFRMMQELLARLRE